MTTDHKPDPEFVEYLKNQVKNPFLSAATVMQMERVFIDQREKYEAKLQAAREQEGGIPKGENDFGLDARYFHEKLRLILRDIGSYTPTEMARALGRMAVTASAETMREPEFNIGDLIDEPKYLDTSPPQSQGVPEWMGEISENLKTQDNRITADPLFAVFQKSPIVVDEDFDHDRIVWVDDEGNEADTETADQLNAMRSDVYGLRYREDEIELGDEDRTEWRRLAIKEADQFVTACFTEAGASAYLKRDGHNLNQPFIFVTSLYRNEEMRQLRDWLLSTPAAPQADEWVKCSDQLPKLGQRVKLFSGGVIQHYMPTLDEGDEGVFWDFEQDHNPLVDFRHDQWMPCPQPPEQGDGV